ncbi:MAG: amidohydrolase family protein [Candidatus Alcyoniella australis]|nr:amidohydrolase family protein [Candidatus Alcyoniella australis]
MVALLPAVAALLLCGCRASEQQPSDLRYAGPIVDTHDHLQGLEFLQDTFNAMDAHQIRSIWLMGRGESRYRNSDTPGLATLEGNNDLILSLARKYPERIKAFPRIRPLKHENPNAAVDELIERGAAGIKLHFGSKPPSSSRPKAADEPYMALYKHCEINDILLMIHLEEQAQPGQIEAIAAACPNLRLIICHLGHAPQNPELWHGLLARHPNLYTDFSFGFEKTYADRAVKLSQHAARWREVVLAHPDQFLYGTDMVIGPRGVRSRQWIEGRFRAYRNLLELSKFHDTLVSEKRTYELDLVGLNLPQDVLRKIYWDNPHKLIP